jgi:hypothetical protein
MTSSATSRSACEGSNMSDDPKGKRTMASETMSFEGSGDIPSEGHGFGIDGAWNSDLGGMQEDLFESLMDFGNK